MELESQNKKYKQAKKRVGELKGFYWHLAVYILVNLFMTANKVIRNYYNGETWNEAFWDFNTFSVWIFWGIGLAFHAFNVFGFPLLFGRNWEEQKIKKIIEEEEKEIEKFRNKN